MTDRDKEQVWIFTFGYGQQHEGHYVKFFGTYGEARIKMLREYGTQWGFQYSEEEWENYVKEAESFAERVYGSKDFALIEKELK
jgi:hypothetical protein